MTRVRDLALLVLVGALFGSSFVFVKIAVPVFGPVPLIAARVLAAAALLAGWAAATGRRLRFPGRPHAWFVLAAADVAVPFTLMAWAQLHVSASLAAILLATMPLFTAALAAAWLRERPAPRAVAGMAVGLLGVALVTGADLGHGGGVLPVAAVLAAAASYAFGNVYAQRRLTRLDPLSLTVGTFAAAGLLLAPGALATAPARLPGPAALAALAALTVACSGLAFVLYFRLLARTSAVTASTIAFLIPAFGTLGGVAFLGERLAPATVAGFVAILASLPLVTGLRRARPGRRSRRGSHAAV